MLRKMEKTFERNSGLVDGRLVYVSHILCDSVGCTVYSV